ncbi:MAG: hypothetical protein CGU28_06090 [Candidatus Dactylopiibacterium carminicum]|uniref:J domain-containing protein n=1 Tax=Candidatus Dactylopiibacterium carminicum TaxID=857335 RepID=A0A272ENG9_9RHOO|nr:J domain-containing protein [Candidatus Dactylopiibacterium carminicum]KAF7599260.1 hypothetical protein BGI27_08720 [Candidatus Dactylopiibacterium carminicum]PAS91653.1 MAG: hypothetical protein CGU29_15265 [Candidatus Dactylopiibacterium carminicum]PAS97188.1 MAG: hypothetical protein CGU28_06090 [Candidatus Dactylopiibacterium carminicum]PAS99268.1 MAG: hypothetical protein BSR46_08755 [Candidatus Dactylopiibacterium carminicum]
MNMFNWLSSDKPAPEALELEAKLHLLETLEEQYAEVQTEYVTLQNALAAFKARYWRRVGELYARLDALRAENARLRARLTPRDAQRQAAVNAASAQANASADAARAFELEPGEEHFAPDEELRKYYRMAARIVHPDRADDEADRSLRDDIMARINVAYRAGHVHSIQALIDEYQMRARPAADDAATRLIRTIRLLARVREQIGEIGEAIRLLRDSSLHRLYSTVCEAEARGEDKLSLIEQGVRRDIAQAEREQTQLQSQLGRREEPLQVVVASEAAASVVLVEALSQEASAGVAASGQICSAAELEIARLLDEMGLNYSYRAVLQGDPPPDGREPAFTIRDARQQPWLWEHLTALENAEQREQWQARQAWLSARGFEVGINLCVTRDEPDGSFDAPRLRKVAEYIRSQCG